MDLQAKDVVALRSIDDVFSVAMVALLSHRRSLALDTSRAVPFTYNSVAKCHDFLPEMYNEL